MSETPSRTPNPDRVGIFMNVLKSIIADLEQNPELQAIFGVPVSASMVVVADQNDLRIEEAGSVPLTEEQKDTFSAILDETIRRNSME